MRSIIRTCLLCLVPAILGGCTKVGLWAANAPSALNNMTVHSDIAYGNSKLQKLDLYIPQNAKNASVLVFFYGGRWTDGHKEQYRFVADAFVDDGYIVAIPDYRKYPAVKFPAFVEDGAQAISWIYNHIEDYGGALDKIYVAGHSSGAHIGALVATDPQYLNTYGLERNIIKGFAGLSGPYAFEPEAEDLKDMFGPPERYPLMRAPNYVDGQQPPMLLIHGLEDTTVVLENAQKLGQAIEEKGGEVELITYEDLNHVETVGSLMWFWRYKSDIKNDIIQFFEEH